MGQKTHPIGFRLGVIKSWNSKWFAGKNFADFIYEDLMVKKYIPARAKLEGGTLGFSPGWPKWKFCAPPKK